MQKFLNKALIAANATFALSYIYDVAFKGDTSNLPILILNVCAVIILSYAD